MRQNGHVPVSLEQRTESSPARIGIMVGDDLIAARDHSTLRKVLLRVRVVVSIPRMAFDRPRWIDAGIGAGLATLSAATPETA